jgi:osmotically inducible protein OsmC
MIKRTSTAVWHGDLKSGEGTMRVGGGAFEGPYSFSSRFEKGAGTNPEELIAASHAGCFSMALSHTLTEAGHPPVRVETTASVELHKSDGGFAIPRIHLETVADVPGLNESEFQKHAESAKVNCPVSKVLSGADITLSAKLLA